VFIIYLGTHRYATTAYNDWTRNVHYILGTFWRPLQASWFCCFFTLTTLSSNQTIGLSMCLSIYLLFT